MPVNILISSVGAKVPLIETVRGDMRSAGQEGILIGGDSNPAALGQYFCDRFLQLPPTNADGDFHLLLKLMKDAGVAIVFPTRDGELPFYARHREAFAAQDIHVMVAAPETIAHLQDKLEFARTLEGFGFPAIPTALSVDLLSGHTDRFVAKPRTGAGMKNVYVDLNRDELDRLVLDDKNFVYQPYIRGREYSVDLYITGKGEPVGAICRERVLVQNGESQVTVSSPMPEVENLCLSAAQKLEIRGHAIFQLIIDATGNIHFIECNARFGGASTLSHAMGLKSFAWFIAESLNRGMPTFTRSPREKRLIRYKQDLVNDL